MNTGQPGTAGTGQRWIGAARVMQAAAVAALVAVAATGQGFAQQPSAGSWQGTTDVRRAPAPESQAPGGANTTVVPRTSPADAKSATQGELALHALLSEEGQQRIEQGLVWRAYAAPAGSAPAGTKPKLVGTWRDATPTVRLPAGDYLVVASFGRAHLSRKISVTPGRKSEERFVLNAGGLRLTALLGSGEKAPEMAVSYDIYAGEADQSGTRAKVLAGVKPGLVVRLNAGIYQVVSTWGDANATVRADVTVEAGKLTEATVTHHGARVTLKLVTRVGGEALADTQWSLHTPQGDLVRESFGALPTHILSPGSYVASARHAGRTFRREFAVTPGETPQIEIVIP